MSVTSTAKSIPLEYHIGVAASFANTHRDKDKSKLSHKPEFRTQDSMSPYTSTSFMSSNEPIMKPVFSTDKNRIMIGHGEVIMQHQTSDQESHFNNISIIMEKQNSTSSVFWHDEERDCNFSSNAIMERAA